MALLTMPSDYVVGTISLINGSVDFTGTGTAWQLVGLKEGDLLIDVDGATQFWAIIDEITSNVAGKLTRPWAGPDLTDALYRMRFTSDGVRSTAQAAMLRQELGNGRVQAISTATGTSGVLEYLPGGGAQLVPKTDLISGAAYDVQVADIAARAAYDGQAAGYAVLVADTGDGRSAIYSKASNASGDWTMPAYVTGPAITLDVTEVDEVPYGEPPDVTLTPRAGGYDMAFQIPRGMIIVPGTTTTLAPDQPAAVTFVPVAGGYRIDIAIPRGPTGDITGVTPFWNMRLVADEDAAAALTGLGLTTFMQQRVTEDETLEDTRAALNIVLADQPTAEAGLDNEQFMTSLRVAQAILALSPPMDTSDLETTVSMLALQVADVSNQALFLGPTGNRVADSFDTLTYVDVPGATSLDTSEVGVLKALGTWSGATFLMRADGTNGSTSFPDAIGSVALTSTGTLVDTSQKKFGTASAAFTSTSYILGDGSTGFAFGTGAFTIDFWVRPLVTTAMYIYDGRNSSSQIVPLIRTNGSSFLEYFVNGAVRITGSTAVTAGAWHHVALSRSAGVTRLFLNGVQQGASWTDASDYINPAARPALGTVGDAPGNSAGFNGYMDEFRVCKGVGQWTANFTPPASAYTKTAFNLTVRSTAFSAATPPAKMKALLRVKEVETAVAGTHYTLECSRDGGTTWATMTLTEMYTVAGLLYVDATEADVSSQPSGTSPRWRFKTLTNKNVELHDVYFYWS